MFALLRKRLMGDVTVPNEQAKKEKKASKMEEGGEQQGTKLVVDSALRALEC